jgi:nitrite reductase/ring-hydroxylating ferredoxin subunit
MRGLASGYNLTSHDEVECPVIQVPEVVGPEHPAFLCHIDEVAEGAAIGVEKELNGGHHAYIVTRSGDQVHAYRNICPHAGRRLDWAPGRFLLKDRVMVCAAHGACFRIETGLCISGPCKGEELQRVGVRVEGEAVLLDEPGELAG